MHSCNSIQVHYRTNIFTGYPQCVKCFPIFLNKNKWKGQVMVPIMEAGDAHGMPTVGQHHLCTVFHAYSTFIISILIFIRQLPPAFHLLSAQNICASAFLIIVIMIIIIFQFVKLAFKLSKIRVYHSCNDFQQNALRCQNKFFIFYFPRRAMYLIRS